MKPSSARIVTIYDWRHLVAVHGHPLRAAAHLAISGGRDRPASMALRAGVLESKQLLGAEGLVVDLRGRLDKVLQMRPQQEVTQLHKLAVVLVLDVDDAPPVLAPADLLAIDNDGLLGTDNGEGNGSLGWRNVR